MYGRMAIRPYDLLITPSPRHPVTSLFPRSFLLNYCRNRTPKNNPITNEGSKTIVKAVVVVGFSSKYSPPYLINRDIPVDNNKILKIKPVWVFM